MDYMERFKLELQLEADTKEVRLGQTKDHLVWRDWWVDEDGERHPVNYFVFEQETGEIICVMKTTGPFQDFFIIRDCRQDFLDWVKNGTGS